MKTVRRVKSGDSTNVRSKKRTVEVFTAGCLVCDSAVTMARELACPDCAVKIYNLNKNSLTDKCRKKVKKYGITKVPTVVVNGKICSCCENKAVNKEALRAAGVGQPR